MERNLSSRLGPDVLNGRPDHVIAGFAPKRGPVVAHMPILFERQTSARMTSIPQLRCNLLNSLAMLEESIVGYCDRVVGHPLDVSAVGIDAVRIVVVFFAHDNILPQKNELVKNKLR